MLRRFLIGLHLAGAALSVALLVSTFTVKGIITSKARSIAIEKTRSASDPLAAKLEETLNRPLIGKAIRGQVRERLEAELGSYRESPEEWLLRLAEGGAARVKSFDFPDIENPLASKAVAALVAGVSELKGHLEKRYNDLIGDIRLFASTNIVAFCIAAAMAWIARTPQSRHWLLAYSFLMLFVFAVSISAYLDRNWTWSILTGDYMGWGYPVTLGIASFIAILRITPELARSKPRELPKP